MSVRRWTATLAAAVTATALSLSVLAGWQRGGTLAERAVWVATGVVLVVSAHLLPALVRDTPLRVRLMGGVLWAACLATACYGHAVFFVLAQRACGRTAGRDSGSCTGCRFASKPHRRDGRPRSRRAAARVDRCPALFP